MSRFSAAPGLLIAVPQLEDPNFNRSVVVMIEHTADGALGLVITESVDHASADVTAGFGLEWPGEPDAQLRRGGPVEPQSLWMLHHDGWCFTESMRVADGIVVSRSPEALTRLCEGGEQRMAMFVGYAGWGPGQLEAELATGSWLVAPTDPALVFDTPTESIWRRALASIGVDPAFLVEAATTVQ